MVVASVWRETSTGFPVALASAWTKVIMLTGLLLLLRCWPEDPIKALESISLDKLVVLVSVGMVSVLTGVTQSGSCCTPVVVCV